jgi:hypothetical protein
MSSHDKPGDPEGGPAAPEPERQLDHLYRKPQPGSVDARRHLAAVTGPPGAAHAPTTEAGHGDMTDADNDQAPAEGPDTRPRAIWESAPMEFAKEIRRGVRNQYANTPDVDLSSFPSAKQLAAFGCEALIIFDVWTEVHFGDPGRVLRQVVGNLWCEEPHRPAGHDRCTDQAVARRATEESWPDIGLLVQASIVGITRYGHKNVEWGSSLLHTADEVLREAIGMMEGGYPAKFADMVYTRAAQRLGYLPWR